jgi:hypothetical protein
VASLRKAGVPVEPIGARYRAEDYFFDAENIRFGRTIEFKDHFKWGDYRDLGQFWRFEGSPLRPASDGRFAPEVGDFTLEILASRASAKPKSNASSRRGP